MAHTHTFRGVEITYDHKAIRKWRIQKALSGAGGAQEFFSAVDEVLRGRSDEVAEAIGGTTEAMGDLMGELVTLDHDAKN